ncbi:MAG TPA: VOC family protein [Streptosporangiaceae bacterium]|jgi:hypothetical protein
MPVRIRTITFDCAEPYRLSLFWAEVTGFAEDPDDPNLPEQEEAALLGTPNLLFVRVPEAKQVKNRVHLDLAPSEPAPAARDAEMERILRLGATLAEDHRRSDGSGWVVLADPEGNEFCVERGISAG